MSEGEGFFTKLMRSGKDAFSAKNILGTIYRFIAFAVLSAFPYIIFNLNEVGAKIKGASVGVVILNILKALGLSVLKGLSIAGSTLWYALTNIKDVFGNLEIGTIIYMIIAFPALVYTIHQPMSLIYNWFDLKKGKEFNPILGVVITLSLTLILSGLLFWANDGQTIFSGVEDVDNPLEALGVTDPDVDTDDIIGNVTEIDEEAPTIDLLGGGT